jgi:hypothetical protein
MTDKEMFIITLKIGKCLQSMEYIHQHENEIKTCLPMAAQYLKSSAERYKEDKLTDKILYITQLADSGLLDAIIDYADACRNLVEASKLYSSNFETIETIQNPDILQKLKEDKDNGDNNS